MRLRNSLVLLLFLVCLGGSRVLLSSTHPPSFIPARSTASLIPNVKQNIEVDLSDWSLEDKIGQLLIVGYRSPQQIQNLRVGGVVLFAWNLGEDIADVQRLITSLQQQAREHLQVPLFIATDQEGGRVLRIRRGMTPFPDAAAMGAIQDPHLAFEIGRSMGLELASLGLNMNFAPVLDVGNTHSFLGNRIWGDRPEQVAWPAIAFIRGQHSSGILSVAKHYPGHASTRVDSHFSLPRVEKSFEKFIQEDLFPFRLAVEEGVQALMTAHVEYPQIAQGPASFSRKFLHEILREKLNFQGLVITDDLEMDGAKLGEESYGDLALKTLKAGTDMILLVWSRERQLEIVERIRRAVESGEVSEAWLDEKVRRVLNVKARNMGLDHDRILQNPFWRDNLRRPETLRLAYEVSSRAIQSRMPAAEKNKKTLRRYWHQKWQVFFPNNQRAQVWQRFRPQDEVIVYDVQSRSLPKKISQHFAFRRASALPRVLVTAPRHQMREEFFSDLEKLMAANQDSDKLPLIWIHQGLAPDPVSYDLNLPLLPLHSSSELSLAALQELLRPDSE